MTDVPNGSAAGGQPGASGAGGEAAPWYSGIADEGLRGYVQTKGFKDVGALATSYQNLEKLQGVPQERLLKLPEKHDDPAWGDVWGRLGRPADAKGYELQFEGDPTFADKMAGVMHTHGVPKTAAAAMNAAWNEWVKEAIEADTAAKKTADEADMAKLRGEWGNTFEANVEAGRRAGREFGLTEEEFATVSNALGSSRTLKLFQGIGAKLGEHGSFDPSGAGQGKGGFGQTPEQAKAKIATLQADKDWVTKYLNGDAAAKSEMEALQRTAAGGA